MSVPLYQLRDYSGDGQPGLLVAEMGATDLSFNIGPTQAQTWLNGAGANLGTAGPFVLAMDAGTPTVEKILCSAVTPSTGLVTVWSSGGSNGRGYDGTTAQGHVAGTTLAALVGVVTLCWTAREAYEANELVSQILGAATEIGQMPVVSGLNPPTLAMAPGLESVQHSLATQGTGQNVASTVTGPLFFGSLSTGALGGPGAAYGWDTTNMWYTVPTTGAYIFTGQIGFLVADTGVVEVTLDAGGDPIAGNYGQSFSNSGGPYTLAISAGFFLSQGTQLTFNIINNTAGNVATQPGTAYSRVFFAFQGPT
jgi:hypothetical protein